MIKQTLLAFFALMLFFDAHAQTNIRQSPLPKSFGYSSWDNKIIIDSAGTIVPTEQWHQKLRTGRYRLEGYSDRSKGDTVKLIKLPKAEQDAMDARQPLPPDSPFFPLGAKFNMFNDKNIDGNQIGTTTVEGKIVVINFWFIACKPCIEEIPDLNAIVASYAKNKDIVFIAVCLDQPKAIKDFMKTQPFNYMQVANGRDIFKEYGIDTFPTNVVIDKKGTVFFSTTGGGYGNTLWLKKAINQCVAN